MKPFHIENEGNLFNFCSVACHDFHFSFVYALLLLFLVSFDHAALPCPRMSCRLMTIGWRLKPRTAAAIVINEPTASDITCYCLRVNSVLHMKAVISHYKALFFVPQHVRFDSCKLVYTLLLNLDSVSINLIERNPILWLDLAR